MLDVISSDAKLSCKAAAIYTLNGLFKLHLCYWFRWRWFYYIRQYDDIQLQPILAEGKKSTADAVLRSYHIIDRGKGYASANDDDGSRTYPSRTKYGAAFASAKHREFLLRTRYFFFGLIPVKMYEYRTVYTIAQLELMNIDAPLTCYKARERDKNTPPTAEELNETVRSWKERKKKRKWKMEDLFRQAMGESKDNNTQAQKE